jgi:hypothetical protein
MQLATMAVGLSWLCILWTCVNAQSNADALWFQPGATITKVTARLSNGNSLMLTLS